MKQPDRFFELLDAPGQLATKINDIVVSSSDRLTQVIDALGNELGNLPKSTREVVAKARGTLDEVRTDVLTLGKHNSDVGTGLKNLETWGKGGQDATIGQPPGLKPGQRVGDVSEADDGQYTGPLDPDTLTPGNWRYWGEHNDLHARTGQIFSKAPTVMDPATGKLLTMGDYANATPDGTPFAPFE